MNKAWGEIWHVLCHVACWVWLGVLYLSLVSFAFVTLTAWQFSEEIDAQAGNAEKAATYRAKLAGKLLPFEFEKHFQELKQAAFDVREKIGKNDPANAVVDAAAKPGGAQAAAIPTPEFAAEVSALLASIKNLEDWQNQPSELSDDATYASLYAALNALEPPGTPVTPLFYVLRLNFEPQRLALWSEGRLAVVLALVMGALGSLLYVTQYMLGAQMRGLAWRDPPPRPLTWFLFRPMFGAIMGLTFLVVVKAGQLTFSSGTEEAAADAGVNPFLLALAAILAGLMSWQALDFLKNIGDRWFRGRQQPLWATGLCKALELKQKTADGLAQGIGRSRRQIERWILLEDKVMPELQDRIASWLAIEPSQVFGEEGPERRTALRPAVAIKLGEHLSAIGQTPADLARALKLESEMVDDWVSRRELVPAEWQDRIADWLNCPIADLFGPPPRPKGLKWALADGNKAVANLAKELGVTDDQAQRWVDGQESPSPDVRARIASWLNTPENEIFQS